jgi:autotransporter passenger strand-loop-strand repeat protein
VPSSSFDVLDLVGGRDCATSGLAPSATGFVAIFIASIMAWAAAASGTDQRIAGDYLHARQVGTERYDLPHADQHMRRHWPKWRGDPPRTSPAPSSCRRRRQPDVGIVKSSGSTFTVSSGGRIVPETLDVLSGGPREQHNVSSGGTEMVSPGGTAINTTVSSGRLADPIIIYGGASETVNARGSTFHNRLLCE